MYESKREERHTPHAMGAGAAPLSWPKSSCLASRSSPIQSTWPSKRPRAPRLLLNRLQRAQSVELGIADELGLLCCGAARPRRGGGRRQPGAAPRAANVAANVPRVPTWWCSHSLSASKPAGSFACAVLGRGSGPNRVGRKVAPGAGVLTDMGCAAGQSGATGWPRHLPGLP